MLIRKNILEFNKKIKPNHYQTKMIATKKKFLKFIKNKKNIKIIQADKGNATVLINKTHEKKMIKNHISDSLKLKNIRIINTKKPLDIRRYHQIVTQRTIQTTKDIIRRKTILKLKNGHETYQQRLDATFQKYRNMKWEQAIPVFIATVKIHKKPMKIRPIIAKNNTAAITLGHIILDILNHTSGHFPGKIDNLEARNSQSVQDNIYSASEKSKLLNIKKIHDNLPIIQYDFATLDVVSMYDNINIYNVLQIINELITHNNNQYLINTNELKELILLDGKDLNYFKAGNKLYRYVKGIPMGGNTSPYYANLYMTYHISKIYPKLLELGLLLIKNIY